MNNRTRKVAEISISNFCNFACDYCISHATNRKIPTNSDGTARVFKDLRYNERGIVDYRRIKKYGLIIRGGIGDTYNFGILNSDDTIDRDGDHIIETDMIDFEKLLRFIRTYLDGWVIQIGGGEPLHNPMISDFLLELVKTHKIILMTNLSLLKSHQSILSIDSSDMYYRIGFHPEQYPISGYLRNINILKSLNKQYIVNLVMHPRYLSNGLARAYVDVLIDNDINYEVTRFKGTWGGISYPTKDIDPRELELLSPHSIEYNVELNPNTPGTTYLSIYPDGNVYQCSTKTMCMGNIYRGVDWTHRIALPHCFGKTCTCQSVISQEHVMKTWLC